MGLLCDYFVAADDQQAEAVVDWVGGPQEGQLATLDGGGIEPVVNLGMFEELLTGKSFHEQLADPSSRPLVANRNGGERLVLRIDDNLIRAIAGESPDRLEALAQPWSQIEEFGGMVRPEDVASFLVGLQALARQAVVAEHHIYCWISV